MERVWLTWETQRRNAELAEAFGCSLRIFDHSALPRVFRYLLSAMQSTLLLIRGPELLIVQCPSIFLAVFVALLKPLGRYRLGIDAHNAAIEYSFSSNPLLSRLMRFAFRSSDFVLVSNEGLKRRLTEELDAKVLVLSDKLPSIAPGTLPERFSELPRPIVTLIASYAADEPIKDFLEALADMSEAFTLCITGSRERAGSLLRFESEKVHFTDFLSAADYDALIGASDLLVDLTTRDDCLVCGAYEAISLAVPILLSDSISNRQMFPKGCLFAENNSASYQKALRQYLSEPGRWRAEVQKMRAEFAPRWEEQFNTVCSALALG